MNNQRKMENLQNLHVALWLLKDCAWCSLWVRLGGVMAVPALLVGIYIAWESRKHIGDLIHNLAVCLWITANIVWMFGEFYWQDGTRGAAKVLFFVGLAVLGGYYLYEIVSAIIARLQPESRPA